MEEAVDAVCTLQQHFLRKDSLAYRWVIADSGCTLQTRNQRVEDKTALFLLT